MKKPNDLRKNPFCLVWFFLVVKNHLSLVVFVYKLSWRFRKIHEKVFWVQTLEVIFKCTGFGWKNQSKKRGNGFDMFHLNGNKELKQSQKVCSALSQHRRRFKFIEYILAKISTLIKKKSFAKIFHHFFIECFKSWLTYTFSATKSRGLNQKNVDKFECFSVFVFNSVRFVGVFSIKLLAKKYWVADA